MTAILPKEGSAVDLWAKEVKATTGTDIQSGGSGLSVPSFIHLQLPTEQMQGSLAPAALQPIT